MAIVTKLRPDMRWIEPYTSDGLVRCSQGEQLDWIGYDAESNEHWFGVGSNSQLCSWCWQRQRCPREFAFAASAHEILFGLLPHASRLAQHLREKVRPWVEPAQSYEKNQLGLGAFFLNSLQLTWIMTLLADAVVLLRTCHSKLPSDPVALGRINSTAAHFPLVVNFPSFSSPTL